MAGQRADTARLEVASSEGAETPGAGSGGAAVPQQPPQEVPLLLMQVTPLCPSPPPPLPESPGVSGELLPEALPCSGLPSPSSSAPLQASSD